MAYWYNRNPGRFRTEVALLRLRTNAKLRWRGSDLVANDVIRVGSYRFRIQIVYPDSFPNDPPSVRLLAPITLPISAEVHRYNSGDLCLFEPDTWAPSLTGAWIHARAVLWAHAMVVYLTTGRFHQPTRPRTR